MLDELEAYVASLGEGALPYMTLIASHFQWQAPFVRPQDMALTEGTNYRAEVCKVVAALRALNRWIVQVPYTGWRTEAMPMAAWWLRDQYEEIVPPHMRSYKKVRE